MLNTETIPNLVNGVSQQADDLRFPSQGDEQVNQYSTVAYGQGKRPPTRYIDKLYEPGVLQDDTDGKPNEFQGEIIRARSEAHTFVVKGGQTPSLDIFSLDGAAVSTINLDAPLDYLASDSPAKALRAISVADFTFILNTEKIVELLPTESASRDPEALVMVKRIERGADYKVKLYDSPTSYVPNYTAAVSDIDNNPDRDPASGDPIATSQNQVATLLRSAFQSNGAASVYTINVDSGIMHVKKTDGSDFRIEVECSISDALYAFKDTASAVSKLPAFGWTGFTIRIEPEAGEDSKGYWVKYVADADVTSGFASGKWEETMKPGIKYIIDPATMPHALVSEGNGEFTFKQLSWGERVVGDDDTNALPSFVGQRISEILFARNRLHMVSGQGCVSSEAGDYYNFFRTSVVSFLASDRIDVTSNHKNITEFPYGVVMNRDIILFSARDQFILSGDDDFTAESVSLEHIASAEYQDTARPLVANNKIIFPFTRQSYSAFYEMMKSDYGTMYETEEITKHIPRYILGDVIKAEICGAEDALIVQTNGYDGLYVYKWFESEGQTLQQAWSKFEFNGGSVRNFFVVDSWLYMTISREDGVYLEKMSLVPNERDGRPGFSVLLDQMVDSDNVNRLFLDDGGDGMTRIELPYSVPRDANLMVVISGTSTSLNGASGLTLEDTATPILLEDGETYLLINAGQRPSGETVAVTHAVGRFVYLLGDHMDSDVRLGFTYPSWYRLSRPTVREENRVIHGDRLQLMWGRLVANDSSSFDVSVELEGGQVDEYTFRSSSDSGTKAVATDSIFTFPIFSSASEVSITLKNDSPYPANYISIEYDYKLKDRRRRR